MIECDITTMILMLTATAAFGLGIVFAQIVERRRRVAHRLGNQTWRRRHWPTPGSNRGGSGTEAGTFLGAQNTRRKKMFEITSWQWWLVVYLTIGWLLMEGIIWAQRKARVPVLNRVSILMVLLAWPITLCIVLFGRRT